MPHPKMTVGELIQHLSKFPPETIVGVDNEKSGVVALANNVWWDKKEEGGTDIVYIQS